ncbi:MAG: Gfo/Idh/MocA family protein [Candidatus Kariarchaeaceae archaeon]|jgi:predicted dehydrogenase
MTSVGIIGTGFGAKVHLPALLAHPDFEVVSIAGRNLEKAKRIAEEASISYTSNWKDLISDKNIELIAVTTPPYLHYQMALKALKANKHLLLEKPTTTTALEARKLLTMANDRGLIGMLCHEFRWVPNRALLAKMIIENKLIGEIREIHFQQFFPFAASSQKPPFNWLWDSAYDGGILGAAGSHLVDQVRSTTGLEFKEVQGQLSTRTKYRNDINGKPKRVTADDGFTITLELSNGATGSLNVSSTMHPSPPANFSIGGDKGVLYLDNEAVFHADTGGEFKQLEIPDALKLDTSLAEKDRRIPPFMKLLDQVSKSIDLKTSLTPNLRDGWRNQLVVDATRKSHQLGTRLKIVDYL